MLGFVRIAPLCKLFYSQLQSLTEILAGDTFDKFDPTIYGTFLHDCEIPWPAIRMTWARGCDSVICS